MSKNLKPYPFCGSKLVNHTRGIIGALIVFMKCGNPECGAVVSFDNDACNFFPEKALTMWNRRAINDNQASMDGGV